jgi:alpha-glucuronidase
MVENKMHLRDEVSVIADYYKNTADEYSVRCMVKEKYSNPIDLTITVPDEQQAQAVCRHWKTHCQKIYEFVMRELL